MILGSVIQFPKQGLQLGKKSAKKHTVQHTNYHFKTEHLYFSGACSIVLEDLVVLTGGHVDVGDGTTDEGAIVSIYDKNGWKRDLPSLQQKRKDHGCASYNDDENNIVSMRNLHFHFHPVYIQAFPSILSHKSLFHMSSKIAYFL